MRTRAEERESAIEVVFVEIGEDGLVLSADLLVCAENDDEEAIENKYCILLETSYLEREKKQK